MRSKTKSLEVSEELVNEQITDDIGEEVEDVEIEQEVEKEKQVEVVKPVKLKKKASPAQLAALDAGRKRAKELRDIMKEKNEFISKTKLDKEMRQLKALEKQNELKKLKQEVEDKQESLIEPVVEPTIEQEPIKKETSPPPSPIKEKKNKKIMKVVKYIRESDSSDSDEDDKVFIKRKGKKKKSVFNSLEHLLREY